MPSTSIMLSFFWDIGVSTTAPSLHHLSQILALDTPKLHDFDTWITSSNLSTETDIPGLPPHYTVPQTEGRVLYVRGIPSDWNIELFTSLFIQYGQVQNAPTLIDLATKQTFRWVVMLYKESADLAMMRMHGTPCHPGYPVMMTVSKALPPGRTLSFRSLLPLKAGPINKLPPGLPRLMITGAPSNIGSTTIHGHPTPAFNPSQLSPNLSQISKRTFNQNGAVPFASSSSNTFVSKNAIPITTARLNLSSGSNQSSIPLSPVTAIFSPHHTKTRFVPSAADVQLLIKHFGTRDMYRLLEFHDQVCAEPDRKHECLRQLQISYQNQPRFERKLSIYNDIHRIFEGRLISIGNPGMWSVDILANASTKTSLPSALSPTQFRPGVMLSNGSVFPRSEAVSKPKFVIKPEDDALLLSYFGQNLKEGIIRFHQVVFEQPNSRLEYTGASCTEPITDKDFRTQIHDNMRRIFEDRLETVYQTDTQCIKIIATPKGGSRRAPQPEIKQTEVEPPSSQASSDHHEVVLTKEDEALLIKYCGSRNTQYLMKMYKRVLANPELSAIHSGYSAFPLADASLRYLVHMDIHRIFENKLTTDFCTHDNSIVVYKNTDLPEDGQIKVREQEQLGGDESDDDDGDVSPTKTIESVAESSMPKPNLFVPQTTSWANIASAAMPETLVVELNPVHKRQRLVPQGRQKSISSINREEDDQLRVVFLLNLPNNLTLQDISDGIKEGALVKIVFGHDEETSSRYAGVIFQHAYDAEAFQKVLIRERIDSRPYRFRFIVDVTRGPAFPVDEAIKAMDPPTNASRRLTIVKAQFFFMFGERELKHLCEKLVGEENIQLIWLYNGGNATVVFADVASAVKVKKELDRRASKAGEPAGESAIWAGLHTSFSKDPCVFPLELKTAMHD